ncbi:methyltransferase domain-containing protein [Sessilibacter corallicola]|uniref:methyltransferase domain-containing protein n=1 Tax=Sessilibacter corallicola TaxID=2904075 RepID=UPI001E31A0E5|nr:methyltransferase domain-containing protein [Sessilibacter corallicola]MCE2028980.1 class I SAM-dependent methyltransferase [Sessilibacter corallicola]
MNRKIGSLKFDLDIDQRLLERLEWRDWSESQKEAIELFLNQIESGVIELESVDQCVCGSRKMLKIASIDRFAIESPSQICVKCGLVITSPRMSRSSLDYYYEEIYPDLLSSVKKGDSLGYLYSESQGEAVYDFIEPYLSLQNELNILDYGAGFGDVLDYISSKIATSNNTSLFAIEKNSRAKEVLESKNITLLDDSDLGGQKKFDLIILSHILEHVHDFTDLLSLLSRSLTPNGLMYIEVPGILSIHTRANYNYCYTGYSIHAHLYNFNLATLAHYCESQSLVPIEGNENIQLLLKRLPDSEVEEKKRSKYLSESKKSARRVVEYLNVIEDVWPSLHKNVQRASQYEALEKKFQNAVSVIRDFEVTINSELKSLGSDLDQDLIFNGLTLFERMPFKVWLLKCGELKYSKPDHTLVATDYIYTKGMTLTSSRDIKIPNRNSSLVYFYSPGFNKVVFTLKPASHIASLELKFGLFSKEFDTQERVALELKKGINRIEISTNIDLSDNQGADRQYACLIKSPILLLNDVK